MLGDIDTNVITCELVDISDDSDSLNNYKFRGYPLSTHNTATLNQYPYTSMGRYNDLDDDGMVPRVDIFQAELAP